MRSLALVVGLLVVGGNLLDQVRALVVPCPYTGGPVAVIAHWLRALYRWVACRVHDDSRRDLLLATAEPLVLLARLVV